MVGTHCCSVVYPEETPYASLFFGFDHCNKKQEELLDAGLDVTVTRREDATFAPNGYIYNVYFDSANEDATDVLQLSADGASAICDSNDQFDDPSETVEVDTVTPGTTAGGILSATQLPLGDMGDSSLEGT